MAKAKVQVTTLELLIPERLHLMGLLPGKSDLLTMRIVQKLREDLGFSEEELEESGLKFNEDGVSVDWSKAITKELEFGPRAKEVVQLALKGLSDKEEIGLQHLSLCDKFEVEVEDAPTEAP